MEKLLEQWNNITIDYEHKINKSEAKGTAQGFVLRVFSCDLRRSSDFSRLNAEHSRNSSSTNTDLVVKQY